MSYCCCSGRLHLLVIVRGSTIDWTSLFLLDRNCCFASSDRLLLDLHPEHLSATADVKLRESHEAPQLRQRCQGITRGDFERREGHEAA